MDVKLKNKMFNFFIKKNNDYPPGVSKIPYRTQEMTIKCLDELAKLTCKSFQKSISESGFYASETQKEIGEIQGNRIGDRRGYGRDELELRENGKWEPMHPDYKWHPLD